MLLQLDKLAYKCCGECVPVVMPWGCEVSRSLPSLRLNEPLTPAAEVAAKPGPEG